MTDLFIQGGVGKLEAKLESRLDNNLEGKLGENAEASDLAAVLCHPHPAFGGSMHDAVVAVLNHQLMQAGITTLRYNSRGVGASEGQYDDGLGECEDVVHVAKWLRQKTGCRKLLLAGYSFGGAMVLAAQPKVQADALILAAPAVPMLTSVTLPDVPTLVMQGDADQFFEVSVVSQALQGLASPESGGSPLDFQVLSGADHFFAGAHDQLGVLVEQFLSQRV